LQDENNFAEALRLVDQAVAILEKAIQSGAQGAHLLPVVLLQRSEVETNVHQYDRAEADARRAIALHLAASPPGSYSIVLGSAQMTLGRALAAQGKLEAAHTAFRTSAENYENIYGKDHPNSRMARQLADN
jgi:tetratricopeptide (TPR) repeat protein